MVEEGQSAEREPRGIEPHVHAREAEAALARARELLAAPGPLDERRRVEVRAALDELAKALAPALAESPAEARAIGHFAEAVAHEATRPEPSESVLQAGIDGIVAAAERLEQGHPALAEFARRIANALANIGI